MRLSYTRIRFPRAHRREWARLHPQAMIEHGGLLSLADLERWACDRCMATLDPDKPIVTTGGADGISLCFDCLLKQLDGQTPDVAECKCAGCSQAEN